MFRPGGEWMDLRKAAAMAGQHIRRAPARSQADDLQRDADVRLTPGHDLESVRFEER